MTQPEIPSDPATCRGCHTILVDYFGQPAKAYHTGNTLAYHPRTQKPVKSCYYGGFVCSRECDHRACLRLERSMPGHGSAQTSLGQDAARSLRKWDET